MSNFYEYNREKGMFLNIFITDFLECRRGERPPDWQCPLVQRYDSVRALNVVYGHSL